MIITKFENATTSVKTTCIVDKRNMNNNDAVDNHHNEYDNAMKTYNNVS